MARTKHTPKNPQIHRPVTAIGRDIQPPRKDIPQAPRKGGKQPRKFISHKMLRKGMRPTGGLKKTSQIPTWYGGIKRNKMLSKIY